MKNEPLFYKSIDILVNAYLNNTLVPRNCGACAVGNLIAGNLNAELAFGHGIPDYKLSNGKIVGVPWLEYDCFSVDRINVEELLGYTNKEIHFIERAFENTNIFFVEDKIFGRLMSVVDVLCEIHEMDNAAKQEAKALFVKEQAI